MRDDVQINFDVARTEQYPEEHQERIAEWMRDELRNQYDQTLDPVERAIIHRKVKAWESLRIAYAIRRAGVAEQEMPF